MAQFNLKNLNLERFQEEVAKELGIDLTKPAPPKPPSAETSPPNATDRPSKDK
jgi:hypothetical protein